MSGSRAVALLCSIFILGGCVTKDLTHENRQRVKTVWFTPVEFSPQQFQFNSMAQAWEAGAKAGASAAAGTSLAPTMLVSTNLSASRPSESSAITSRQAIVLNMQRNGIDVGAMLRDRLKAKITDQKLFLIVTDEVAADAKIQIMVNQWGLSLINFSEELYPVLGVFAMMKRGDEQIWRNFETVTAMTTRNDKAFTPQRYANDPDALRMAFDRAIDLVTDKLITDLKQ